jgi:hypothetical protein
MEDTVVETVDAEYVTTSSAESVIEVTAAGTHMMVLNLPIVETVRHTIPLIRDINLQLTIRSTPEIDGLTKRSHMTLFLRNHRGYPARVLQAAGLLS